VSAVFPAVPSRVIRPYSLSLAQWTRPRKLAMHFIRLMWRFLGSWPRCFQQPAIFRSFARQAVYLGFRGWLGFAGALLRAGFDTPTITSSLLPRRMVAATCASLAGLMRQIWIALYSRILNPPVARPSWWNTSGSSLVLGYKAGKQCLFKVEVHSAYKDSLFLHWSIYKTLFNTQCQSQT